MLSRLKNSEIIFKVLAPKSLFFNIPLTLICTLLLYFNIILAYLCIIIIVLIHLIIRSSSGLKVVTQSVSLLFGTLIILQLILGFFRISYYTNSYILIMISLLSHSLFFYFIHSRSQGVFRSAKNLKLLIISSLPYMVMVVYNLSLNKYERFRWALSGWDHIGQHVAQITFLKGIGYFNYDVTVDPESGNITFYNMYPRALHSIMMFYLSMRRNNNTSIFIADAFVYLSIFELILIFLIIINMLGILIHLFNLKQNYIRPIFLIVGSSLVGIFALHDLFLNWFLRFGWSNSLFTAFIISSILLIYHTTEKHLIDLITILLLNIILVHTWPYFIVFVFLNLLFFMYKYRMRFGLPKLLLMLFVFFAAIGQIIFFTIKFFLNKSSVSSNAYTPGISNIVVIFLLLSFIFYIFICNFNQFYTILPYFFLIVNFLIIYRIDDSRFQDLNYVASKFLQVVLLIAIPFLCILLMYIGNRISGFLFIPLLVLLMVIIFVNSRQGIMQLIGRENLMGSTISLPSSEKVKFLMNFKFDKFSEEKIVFWNEDGFDYSNSYWFIIGGIESIDPVSANNIDRNTLCEFTNDEKKTLIFSTKSSFIQEFRDTCKFNYSISLVR